MRLRRFHRYFTSAAEARVHSWTTTSFLALFVHAHVSRAARFDVWFTFRDGLPRIRKYGHGSRTVHFSAQSARSFGNGRKRAIDGAHRRRDTAVLRTAVTHFDDAPTRSRIPYAMAFSLGARPCYTMTIKRAAGVYIRWL